MRIFIDTEFNEYHGALISMALVAEDGREWYGVRFCDDPGWWVREHVMPKLLQQPERDADLRTGLAEFLGQFDAVHIVSDWPGDIAHFCNFLEFAPGDRIGPDTMTFEVRRDLPDTATTSEIPHNALEDARALARAVHNCQGEGRGASAACDESSAEGATSAVVLAWHARQKGQQVSKCEKCGYDTTIDGAHVCHSVWPELRPGKIGVFRDEQLELLDDLADLCEYWKRSRDKGRTPNALRSALVMLAADIAKTTMPPANA